MRTQRKGLGWKGSRIARNWEAEGEKRRLDEPMETEQISKLRTCNQKTTVEKEGESPELKVREEKWLIGRAGFGELAGICRCAGVSA